MRGVATVGLLVALAGCKEPKTPPASDNAAPEAPTPPTEDPPTEAAEAASAEGKGGLVALTNEIVTDARKQAADPALLLPDDAQMLVVIGPRTLFAFEPAADLWALVEKKDDDLRGSMETFRSCVGQLDTIERITIGSDFDDRFLMAMEAPGIGTREVWDCFRDKTIGKGKTWDTEITGTPIGEGPQLRAEDGDPGYFMNEDTVVLVSKAWGEAVEQRRDGGSERATPSRLSAMLSRVEADDPLRALGFLDAETSTSLATSLGAEIEDFAVGLRPIDGELRVELSFQADSAAQATAFKDGLTAKLEEYKGLLPMIGVPPSLSAKLSFGTEGSLTTMSLRITADEFGKVVESIGSSI